MKKFKIKVSFEREYKAKNEEDAFMKFIEEEVENYQSTPMDFILDNLTQEEIK